MYTKPDKGPALQELSFYLTLLITTTIQPVIKGFAHIQVGMDVQLDLVAAGQHNR